MHTDPELLALLAVGERVGTDADREHLTTCPTCSEELSDLRRLVSLARSAGPEVRLSEPGPAVWDRIRIELELGSMSEPIASESRSAQLSLLDVIPVELIGPDRDKPVEIVAHANLTPSEPTSSGAAGAAVLATDELGRRILQVVLKADLTGSGVRQAWLVHRDDATQKQTLGILDGRYGVWTVDRSIDLEQYPIVDISEQSAGEVEHSGRTIVRGRLVLAS